MKTKNTYSEPKLRFSGYSDKWSFFNLEDHCERISVGLATEVAPYYREKGVPIVRNLNIKAGYFDDTKMLYLCEKFSQDNLSKATKGLDVLTVRTGSNLGQTCVLPERFNNCQTFTTLITSPKQEQLDSYFLSIHMNSFIGVTEFTRLQVGGGKGNMNTSNLKKYRIAIPSISEQRKIADFLSSVDKKISILKEKYTLLEQYKKGVMQKLFSQKTRFKDEKGNDFPDWIKGTLGDLSNKVSNKNKDESVTAVLTNSAKSGIVNQTDYFKKDIANENNLGGYSIVEKNDFVYNPRISVLAPVGPIKRNHVGQGVMSPLYTIFRFKNEGVLDYLEYYFGTTEWHRYMNSIANIGARHDRMNITMGDFFNLPIPIPSQGEMLKIVGFVESLNKKVDLVAQQLKQTQNFKKGLLQQMFV